jgi:hypothetical protein
MFWGIACSTESQEELVDVDNILPENSMIEIQSAYPDFAVFLVAENDANVAIKFEDNHLRIDGIEDDRRRERIARHVVDHLENPNKRAEDKARREAYNNLPPKEKMAAFVDRIKRRYPNFDYEWAGLKEGNVKVEYGDNSLIISGIDDQGAMEEVGYGIHKIQKEIDKAYTQDKDEIEEDK